jgi:SWI/SNF-related matrix-associated actin-dependent regulator 1 of chromatin subfamily A
MTKIIDYHVKINRVSDLEDFSQFIKDAVVSRIALVEHFSGVRLASQKLLYNDWLHKNRGLAHETGLLEVRQQETALDLAGTILHELAHALVGVREQHSANWNDACKALGLVNPRQNDIHIPSDFAADVLEIIERAIELFAKQHPTLIYDANIIIPWPIDIGTPDCICEACDHTNSCDVCKHRHHILKFQIEGIREMLSRLGNILLADDMGVGKTVEMMGYINATNPKRIFIGCPNNVKLIWKRHFEDFCIHKYDVEVAYTQLYTFGDVVIMNYEAINKWGDAIKRQDWDLIIYDEGHYLKNPSAKRSRACYAIHGKKATIVTGSPIVNYPEEIFPLIHYLDRENWPEFGRFENEYKAYGNRFGRNLNRLNAKLRATIMTRRQKKDVLSQLPRKRRQIVEFEVSDDVRKLIEEEKKLFAGMQGDSVEQINFLNAMRNESDTQDTDFDWAALIESMKYTRKYAFEEMAKVAHMIARAKLPLAIEHIENALESREKVAVFGHHRDVLETIVDRFAPNSVLLMGGNLDQSNVAQMATNRYSNDPTCTLFVGGVTIAQGYSLKGGSTVIFVEEDWVPGTMTQAEDRLHGIGRGDADAGSLLIQHLVFEDSLDTYKAKLTIKKQKSIDKAMNK